MKDEIVIKVVNDKFSEDVKTSVSNNLKAEIVKMPEMVEMTNWYRANKEWLEPYMGTKYIVLGGDDDWCKTCAKIGNAIQTIQLPETYMLCNKYMVGSRSDFGYTAKKFVLYPYVDSLSKEGRYYYDTLKDLIVERYTFQKKLEGVMKSINTDKQLLSLLPELEKYIPNVETTGVPVPMEQIVDIRDVLKSR